MEGSDNSNDGGAADAPRRDQKAVQLIDETGAVLQEFESGTACATALRLTVSEVSAVCRYIQAKAQGKILQFKDPAHREQAKAGPVKRGPRKDPVVGAAAGGNGGDDEQGGGGGGGGDGGGDNDDNDNDDSAYTAGGRRTRKRNTKYDGVNYTQTRESPIALVNPCCAGWSLILHWRRATALRLPPACAL